MAKRFVTSGETSVCETDWCSETFPLLRKGGKQRRFCSDSCRETWRAYHRHPRRKQPLSLVCQSRHCGKSFEHWRLGQTPRFCGTACQIEERDEARRDVKSEAVAYLGGRCSRCGYDKCLGALHFHHVDPSTKTRKISDFARTSKSSWDERKEELDKCILLCANCHAEEHDTSRGRR